MQADLNLCWVHMSEGMFSHIAAHMCFLLVEISTVLVSGLTFISSTSSFNFVTRVAIKSASTMPCAPEMI